MLGFIEMFTMICKRFFFHKVLEEQCEIHALVVFNSYYP